MSILTKSSLSKGGQIRHGCYFSSLSYSKSKAWNIWLCKKKLTKESFRIPKDQSAADNDWGNKALECARYDSNTFEYVKPWNSKTRPQWPTLFGSDTPSP